MAELLVHDSGGQGSSRTQFVTASARREDSTGDPERDLLLEAHERFRVATNADRDWRRRAEEEINFVDHYEHWPQQARAERAGRPCLTFDRIGPAVRQVVNDARQNPPEPKFAPVGGGADEATAEVLQGLLRNIENDSEAEIAYMTAYEFAVKVGLGWMRVLFEWEDDETFHQKIRIAEVPNPFSIYPDPSAVQWDMRDMGFCFVTEDMDRNVYKEQFPDSAVAGMADFESVGDRIKAEWFPSGAIRVAEYWYTVPVQEKLFLLPGGMVVPEDEVYDAKPMAERIARKNKVYCVKINGKEILEGPTEWPGRWIPIIPCLGMVSVKDGKRVLRGMVRAAMDANLHYDYLRSKEAEAAGLAPIVPWLVAEGQIEGFEYKWADANRRAFPFLEYKPFVGGMEVPPPQRLSPDINIAGLTNAVQQADNDIKATLSTYDASLGAPGPEQSGRAILARQHEGDNAHFDFHDNLARAMRHCGRVVLDLIPKIYTEERTIMITNPDGSSKTIDINQPTVSDGISRIFDVKSEVARYHVTIGSQPSYASRRQEGRDAVIELMRMMPQPMTRALDIAIKALDIPYGDELADRLRPPDVAALGNDPRATLAQMQQQLSAMTVLNQHLQAALAKATDDYARERLKYASQERVAAMNNEALIAAAALKANSAESMALLAEDMETLRTRMQLLSSAVETANPPIAGGEGGPSQQPPLQAPSPEAIGHLLPAPAQQPGPPGAPPVQQ